MDFGRRTNILAILPHTAPRQRGSGGPACLLFPFCTDFRLRKWKLHGPKPGLSLAPFCDDLNHSVLKINVLQKVPVLMDIIVSC